MPELLAEVDKLDAAYVTLSAALSQRMEMISKTPAPQEIN
jgi:hypothetical protein